jgi:citrate lyase subunit beta/citryl-CoA lyase
MHPARSYLYVPGDRPERLERAFLRKADQLIVDLEDAVAPAAKDFAVETVLDWLTTLTGKHAPVWVRVNCGERGHDEMRRLVAHASVAGFCLPKTETAEDLRAADQVIEESLAGSGGGKPREIWLAPLLESASSIVNVHEIAAAPRVRMLHIGEVDLAADLGVTAGINGDEFRYVRSLIVIASRAAKLCAPPAPVSVLIDDDGAFRTSTEQLKAMGFIGRACIHPGQVAIANEVFTVTSEEVSWARGIIDRAGENAGASRGENGSMVDEAVARRARAIWRTADGQVSAKSAGHPSRPEHTQEKANSDGKH